MSASLYWFAALLLFLSNGALITHQQNQSPVLWWCYDSAGNYTANSLYETNLETSFLPTLAANAIDNYTTYYSTNVGRDPDRVYGFAQCMSQSSVDDCRACLNVSATAISNICPNRRQAYVRYENCVLRYSNQSFVSQLETFFYIHYRNSANASQPALFSQRMGSLMRNLTRASAQSPSRFAAGNAQYTDLSNVYGMAQCTRDISSTDCLSCLEQLLARLDNRVGARVYVASCSVRYEIYPFYPADGLTPPSPPSSPPPNLVPTDASPPTSQSGSDRTNSTRLGNSNSNGTRNIIIGSAVGGISVFAVMILFIWWLARRRRADSVAVEPRSETMGDESKPNLLFDLNEIRAATNNFSEANKLGQGGFGPVYKGTLGDGQQIAVKRLQASSGQGITELKNEMALLVKLLHRNLVKLMGCCLENQEKLLVYEFVINSSLDKFLFDRVKKGDLKWEFRFKIIGGIARGLLYLHEDSRLRIIHRDLKASSILLDGEMNAKISDFGLAKIFGSDQTQGNTSRIAGTFGYMSPEYVMHGLFSMKSDVFSFGVLVMEIVTGRSNSVYSETGDSINLLSHVWRHWTNGSIPELIDESLDGYPMNEVVKCIHIGLLCVQEDPTERPTMSNIVVMLNSHSVTLSAPSPPAFCYIKSHNSSYSSSIQSQTSGTNANIQSVNDVSVSELYPR